MIFPEHTANFRDRPIPIIRHGLDQQSGSTGTVPFQRQFLIVDARQFSGASLNGAFNGLGRHVGVFGFGHGSPQARIRIGVSTRTGGHGEFAEELGKQLSPFGIDPGFMTF